MISALKAQKRSLPHTQFKNTLCTFPILFILMKKTCLGLYVQPCTKRVNTASVFYSFNLVTFVLIRGVALILTLVGT